MFELTLSQYLLFTREDLRHGVTAKSMEMCYLQLRSICSYADQNEEGSSVLKTYIAATKESEFTFYY
jgi:hypothetical protein